MDMTIRATFDGEVLRPDEPIPLLPNTRVRITIEAPGGGTRAEEPKTEIASFLETALSLNLDGPPDWSARMGRDRLG